MRMTDDRADFPAGTAVSGSGTEDSSGINGPFTECDALMRERDALVYHRQMLERKRSELEQSLQKQRSENALCSVLFVFFSAEALLIAMRSDRIRPTFSTHGISYQCVHNSLVPSSWSTPIGSGVGGTGLTEYQKPFHAQYLKRTLQLVEDISLCSENHVAVMRALTTFHPAPMLRRLELNMPELSEGIVQYITQWETEGHVEHSAVRLYRITPTLPLLCRLSSLRSLKLGATTITDDDFQCLQGCHNLVKLDLSFCRRVTDVSPISHIETVEVVIASGCQQLVKVGTLGKLPRLKELELSETPVADEEISLLSKCGELVKIDLSYCKTLTNVNPLSCIATLEVINLSNCTSLIHVGALGKLVGLKKIDLSGTAITDRHVRLLRKCHTLENICLYSCESVTNVNPLSFIAALKVINLSRCSSLIHLRELGMLPVLMEVYLWLTDIKDEEVNSLTSLRHQLGLPSIDIWRDV